MAQATMYKIVFVNQSKVYEIFAEEVMQSGMFGFVEVSGMRFEQSSMLIDPAEEKLKAEFSGVKRTFIPMQAIIRIDEVQQQGTAKIHELGESGSQVLNFPNMNMPQKQPPGGDKSDR